MSAHAPFTIRKLLLIAFLLAGLLPALLVSILSFYQAGIALRSEIKHDLQTTGQAVGEHIDHLLQERVQNVRNWSQLAIMQDMQIGDIDKRLSIFLADTRKSYAAQYVAIDVIDLQSVVIASSDPQRINQHLSTPPVWFAFQDDHKPITFYHLQHEQLMISTPVTSDITQQVIGHLVATFNWAVIQQVLNRAAQNATEIALVDDSKRLLAQSENWSQPRHTLHTHTPMHSSTLPLQGWEIRLNKEHAVAVAPVHRLGLIFIVVLLVILAFSLLMLRPIARRITQPLEALSGYVRRLRQPEAQAPPLQGPAEVQALHQAFTGMATELAAYEQQLTRAAKLAVVGEMAAAMSHEVRTPLGIMRSSADVLKREPALSADGREVLGFIISETERLNKLVSALIDAARPRLPSKIPLDLRAHLQHVCDMLQPQARDRQQALTLRRSDAVVVVAADPDQITQIMVNLIMNAIQIVPAHGRIEVTLSQQADTATICVADDGPGVPLAQEPHLFEAFFTQRAGGVGLGLAIVKQIVEAHGGTISYSASPWQGAQFNLIFPLDRP